MVWKRLDWPQIEGFKRSWPCHGLPDNLAVLECEFAANGDLVDLRAYGSKPYANHFGMRRPVLDTAEFDGPALLALVADCQAHGMQIDN